MSDNPNIGPTRRFRNRRAGKRFLAAAEPNEDAIYAKLDEPINAGNRWDKDEFNEMWVSHRFYLEDSIRTRTQSLGSLSPKSISLDKMKNTSTIRKPIVVDSPMPPDFFVRFWY